MACDSFLTFGAYPFTGIWGGPGPSSDSVFIGTREVCDTALDAFVTSVGCAAALPVVPSLYEPPFGAIYNGVAVGLPLDLTTLLTSLVVDTPPGFIDQINFVFVHQPLVGPSVDLGGDRYDVAADGSFVKSSTLIQPNIVLASGDTLTLRIREGHLVYFTLTFDWLGGTIITAVNDPAGYLGCVVPACGVSPTSALPAFGPAVKCANFSKIFNPLGIPLRSE